MRLETWKVVPGYKGLYEVSDLGRVRMLSHRVRCGRGGKGSFLREAHILNAKVSKSNVCPRRRVDLYRDGKAKTRLVAHLVAEAFIGKRPRGQHCCHRNGNSLDDRLANLRYDTVKGNQHDRYKHKTQVAGEDHPNHKLTLKKVLKIRKAYACGGVSYADLATKYKVSWGTIQDIIKMRTWPYDADGNFTAPEDRQETPKENNRTKQAVKYTAMGMSKTLKEWGDYTGIAFATIASRIKHGWSLQEALTKPVR